MDRIYFDFNATTPIALEVASAMQPYLHGQFGNPSSHHWAGERTHAAVEAARQQVADHLHCETDEVVFTSGGTEANNFALAGVFFSQKTSTRPQIIISNIEHPSIVKTCEFLERLGATVKRIPVDGTGLVDAGDIRRAITADTVLISVMHANNEVGTIEPIQEIAAVAHEQDVLLHTDAAQSIGKIAVDVRQLGVDLLTVAGHKMYAPQGVGALFIRRGLTLEPFLHGGGHEAGRRSGTENVASIVGLGTAFELAADWIANPQIQQLRDYFWQQLSQQFGERIVLNGHPDRRLPNTLNVSLPGHNAQDILSRLPSLAASTGSACHADVQQISPVLAAMGIATNRAAGAIRFSLGRTSTRGEIDAVIPALAGSFR